MAPPVLTLTNNRVRQITEWRHTRTGGYVLKDAGRWGPRWLHALVMRAARNLGMVGNHRESFATDRVQFFKVRQSGKLDAMIYDAARPYFEKGFHPRDLEVVCGQDIFDKLTMAIVSEASFSYPSRFVAGDWEVSGAREFNGIRFRLIPFVSGFAVLPRADAYKA